MPGEADLILKAGAKWIRCDLAWKYIELTEGVYNYNYNGYTSMFATMLSKGIRGICILAYNNPLYWEPSQTGPESGFHYGIISQNQIDKFIDFVLDVLSNYGGRGHVWEIWNEPNVNSFWYPTASASEYANFANQVVDAIRANYPDEYIALPGMGAMPFNTTQATYWHELGKSGLFQKADIITAHCYTDFQWNRAITNTESIIPAWNYMKEIVGRYAVNKVFWNTEWGYDSALTSEAGQRSFNPTDYRPAGSTALPPNVLTHTNNLTDASWIQYWTKPTTTGGVKDPLGGNNAFRFNSLDHNPPSNVISGTRQLGTLAPGLYTVSCWLRCLSGYLSVFMGPSDNYKQNFIIDSQWRRYWATFEVTTQQSSKFIVYETEASNQAWEIFGPQVETYTGAVDLSGNLENKQAERLVELIDVSKRLNMGLTTIYGWENDGVDPTASLANYGVVLNDRITPKPAYHAVANKMRSLRTR